MKQVVLIFLILSLSGISKAQTIKSFECSKSQEADSCIIVYSVKVTFNSNTTDDSRLNLVKMELNKRYQIETDNIISIQSWFGKRFRTFLYTIKVHQNVKGCKCTSIQNE